VLRFWPLVLTSFLVLVSPVSVPTSSLAQKADTTAQPTAFQDTTIQDTVRADFRPKDPSRAVWYSVGATVLFAPVFGAGIVVGPAAGHFYAGNSGQAWRGIGIRVGAAAAPVLLAEAVTLGGNDGAGEAYTGLGVFLVSGVVAGGCILYSIIHDIATADNSARQYNRTRGPTTAALQVAPTLGGPQGRQIGMTVRVEF